MDFDKGSKGLDVFAYRAAGAGIRRDRSTDGDAAVLSDLGCDITDATDVQVAVFFACLLYTSPSPRD